MRQKKCKGCGQKFMPERQLQSACGFHCAVKVVEAKKKKEKRKKYREAKERMKSRQDWLREAQAAVNRYVRLRDAGEPCISCGRDHQGQYHAGHYRSVGACPELRFDERNIHKQCAPCNNHLSGNIVAYRHGLIERIGVETVEWLEGEHQPKHYSIDEIKEIKARFSKLSREILNESRFVNDSKG